MIQRIGKSNTCSLQKGVPSLFSLAWNRVNLDNPLKEELTDLFWKLPDISYSHTGRVDSEWFKLTLYVSDCLENKSM